MLSVLAAGPAGTPRSPAANLHPQAHNVVLQLAQGHLARRRGGARGGHSGRKWRAGTPCWRCVQRWRPPLHGAHHKRLELGRELLGRAGRGGPPVRAAIVDVIDGCTVNLAHDAVADRSANCRRAVLHCTFCSPRSSSRNACDHELLQTWTDMLEVAAAIFHKRMTMHSARLQQRRLQLVCTKFGQSAVRQHSAAQGRHLSQLEEGARGCKHTSWSLQTSKRH